MSRAPAGAQSRGGQLVGQTFVRETGGRHSGGALRRAQLAAAYDLLRHARSGRYHGGLWFKVFSERGPC
jgi:hypothetical protein